MQVLVEEMAKTQLEIVAIQETKWSGAGLIKKKYLSLYYSGIIDNIIGFEAINERLCKIRIKSKYNNLTLINMYAPTEDTADTEKEKFL